MGLGDRLKHAWNAFTGRDPTRYAQPYYGPSSYFRNDWLRRSRGSERSIVASIINRISMDVASTTVTHAQLDQNGRFLNDVSSGLNECLHVSANIDQTGRAFVQDAVHSLLDEGSIAIVPVDTSFRPNDGNVFDIQSMRVGKIVEWYPKHVKVNVYNENAGKREDLILPKTMCAIVENPLYAAMNEPNSTLQRLIRKLSMLDTVDEQSSSGKLDLIIQLPYVIKGKTREEQAEERRKKIEMQLAGSKYGIAYIDGTEKITQLNRAVENNLLNQIQYLTSMLYSQLGMPSSVFEGTADDATMLNYYNRTIEPILSAITDEMKRKFLTKTARTKGQSIVFFRDPFKLVPVSQMADIADKFTRNEVLSSNEVRQIIGYKPSDDPKADELRNKNINVGDEQTFASTNDVEEEQS